jgi:hypothetical protein
MDQALLHLYLGEKSTELRQAGIRGAIELAALVDDHEKAALIGLLSKLGLDPEEFMHLARTLDEDTQVTTLLRLWGSLDPEEELD